MACSPVSAFDFDIDTGSFNGQDGFWHILHTVLKDDLPLVNPAGIKTVLAQRLLRSLIVYARSALHFGCERGVRNARDVQLGLP